MRILIIRHGEPFDGHLTEKGKREVEVLAKGLADEHIDYYYVSPLERAMDTAAPTLKAKGVQGEVLDWLQEFEHPVVWEDGKPYSCPWDVRPAAWTAFEGNFSQDGWREFPMHRDAGIPGYYDEVVEKLDALIEKHGYRRDGFVYRPDHSNTETIAFFCHFGLSCVMLSRLLNLPIMPVWHGFCAAPTSITELRTEERQKGTVSFRMSKFGDVSHLVKYGEPVSPHARFCEVYEDFTQRHD